jgi:2-oxo-4-hydroxy-4-carboxy-5-ureidoimidazoline decarboxylase
MANGIQWFNTLSWAEASQTLTQVCPAPAFVAGMLSARESCRTDDDLLEQANRVLAGLPEDELGVALSGHTTEAETTEPSIAQRLARAAAAYRAKFGQAFIAHRDDRDDSELLGLLRDRLENSVETEREIARAELSVLTKSRLTQLLTRNTP